MRNPACIRDPASIRSFTVARIFQRGVNVSFFTLLIARLKTEYNFLLQLRFVYILPTTVLFYSLAVLDPRVGPHYCFH